MHYFQGSREHRPPLGAAVMAKGGHFSNAYSHILLDSFSFLTIEIRSEDHPLASRDLPSDDSR